MSRDDYIEVSERIRLFVEQYPTGSLQADWGMVDRDSEQWLAVKAYAYRYPDDARPGIGHAWEPIPGRTPFTKGSELMNGETSAWGRALAAIGIAVNKGVASANEIRSAQGRADNQVGAKVADMGVTDAVGRSQAGRRTASHAKTDWPLKGTMSKQHINEAVLADYCQQQLGFELPVEGLGALTKAQASVIIDALLKLGTPTGTRSIGPVEDNPWVTS